MTASPPTPPLPQPPSRREILAGAAGLATITYFWFEGFGEPLRRRGLTPTENRDGRVSLEAAEWESLEAAVDRLLPSGPDSPGARTVNAIGYLDRVLAEPHVNPETVTRVRKGAHLLDERARGRAEAFGDLDAEAQDAVLATFEETAEGVEWLRTMLSFVLEAFFGDPVHGANPGEVAWKWAGHRPGFPRPTQPGWTMPARGGPG